MTLPSHTLPGPTATAPSEGLVVTANGNSQRLGTRHHLKKACSNDKGLRVSADARRGEVDLAERVRRAGLDVDAGDIIGRGLREPAAEGRDLALIETFLSALER